MRGAKSFALIILGLTEAVHCANSRCRRRTPMALTPLIIRWGPDASSDLFRRSARCGCCGHKGATLQHPSWGGREIGWLPFPARS
jgi:hypothetical protein